MDLQLFILMVLWNGGKIAIGLSNEIYNDKSKSALDIWPDCSQFWYQNGRLNGPSCSWDGYLSWRQNGRWHRLNGPAVIFCNGYKEW